MERKIVFDVSMDNDSEAHTVNTTVVISDDQFEDLIEDAIRSQKIKWQGQIRRNWETFLESGIPERIEYGQVLYGRTRRRGLTEAEIEDRLSQQIAKLTPEGITFLAVEGKLPPKDVETYWK